MNRLLRSARFRWDLFVWARLIPLFAARDGLADLVARVEPRAGGGYPGLDPAAVARKVKRAVRRPLLMREQRCLREGLLAYRCLKRAGREPTLHFGIQRASVRAERMAAHCWVTLEGRMVLNPPPEGYVEIYRFGGDEARRQ